MCFDTRRTSKLDGILVVSKVGIPYSEFLYINNKKGWHPHPKSTTTSGGDHDYTYTNVKFI
jgi:hypothetical protein